MKRKLSYGLSFDFTRSRPIYLTRADGHAVMLEVRLRSTAIRTQRVSIGVHPHGERGDLAALGISEQAGRFEIGMAKTMEIAPGVLVIVRRDDRQCYVTRTSATMVFSADPAIWRIERSAVLEARINDQTRHRSDGGAQ